jgi:eukaryotic-like serine/threonine-protein kinase
MLLTPGLLVTQSVRLVRPLGEGGMGTVWVGEHLGLQTEVAVKFISPELSHGDPEIFERFQREARIAARIKSQHVVQVFDHGVMGDDTPFIVMELLQGSSLAEWLDLTNTVGVGDTAQIVTQVAGVLGKAHELDIVHRDIKPANIFLVDSEDALFVKVLDFGIAKETKVAHGSLRTGTGVLVGTPDYMSPEQLLHAGPVDRQADLWGLAVVAYRAITGDCPFRGQTLAGVIVAITEGAFRPPSTLAPQPIPAALDAWFARALARDPGKRFATARELAETFQRAASAPAVATAPVPAVGSEVPTRRPAPPVAAEPEPGRPAAPRGKAPSRVRAPRLELPEPPTLPEQVLHGALVTADTQHALAAPPQGPARVHRDPQPMALASLDHVVLAAPVREPTPIPRPRIASLAPDDELPSHWLGDVGVSVATGAVTLLATYMVDQRAMSSFQSELGAGAWGPLGVGAAVLVLACWRAWLQAQRLASLLVWLVCLGLGVLGGSSAVAAAALVPALRSLGALLPWALAAAPLAGGAVLLGLGLTGLLRAKADLLGAEQRRPLYGVLVLLLALAGLGLSYRLLQRSSVVQEALGGSAAAAP